MAKLRIFVSSTYYDLKHIRNYLEAFIESFGYDPVLFESGDIPFEHGKALDESCYKEIINSHMQILIIGGRYGSEESKTKNQSKKKKTAKGDQETEEDKHRRFNSITKMEYKAALEQNIPVFIFVENPVLAEYNTYRNNRDNDSVQYAHVDSINVFRLIDEIYTDTVDKYVKGFDKFEDISNWLRDQWSGMFADFLKRNKDKIEIQTLSTKIDELNVVSSALKEYTEAILENTLPEKSKILIQEEDRKIEHSKINRFMSSYFFTLLGQFTQVKLNFYNEPDRVYSLFKTSNVVDEFLNKLGYPKSEIKRLEDYIRIINEQPFSIYSQLNNLFKTLKYDFQNIEIE